jgi:hypothetical protein
LGGQSLTQCQRQARARRQNDATNAILVGPNGIGKSTLAQNIAYQAVIHGHTVLFATAGQLLGDLAALLCPAASSVTKAREAAGLHASVMPWLKERDIALLGSDAVNDVQPSGIVGGSGEAANRPVHFLSIAIMGMPLVDNGYFEDAAREAAIRKRWDFFMTLQLTRLSGGTATNFNALAIF